MIYQITVPAVADDVEEIRVLEWHGDAGHAFASGDMVVEFETHKALVEVRAGQAGVLRRVLAEAGEWAKVGVPIALFTDGPDEALPEAVDAIPDMLVDFQVD